MQRFSIFYYNSIGKMDWLSLYKENLSLTKTIVLEFVMIQTKGGDKHASNKK